MRGLYKDRDGIIFLQFSLIFSCIKIRLFRQCFLIVYGLNMSDEFKPITDFGDSGGLYIASLKTGREGGILSPALLKGKRK